MTELSGLRPGSREILWAPSSALSTRMEVSPFGTRRASAPLRRSEKPIQSLDEPLQERGGGHFCDFVDSILESVFQTSKERPT